MWNIVDYCRAGGIIKQTVTRERCGNSIQWGHI